MLWCYNAEKMSVLFFDGFNGSFFCYNSAQYEANFIIFPVIINCDLGIKSLKAFPICCIKTAT